MFGRWVLFGFAAASLAACGGSFCEEYPQACGEPPGGSSAGGAGTGGSGASAGGAAGGPVGGDGGGGPDCVDPCVANDRNTTADCIDSECVYGCLPGFLSCDEDPTTCEVAGDEDGNCGACGADCAYDECAQIDDVFACNDPVDIDAGDFHTCAIKRDGSVWCWGINNFGQLGINTGTNYALLPAEMTSLPASFRAVRQSQGTDNGCVQSDAGALACWPAVGANSMTTTQVVTGSGVDQISTFDLSGRGDESLVAQDGVAVVSSFVFQLDATTISLLTTAQGAGQAVSTAGTHRCAIFLDGALKCWGIDAFGQIGNGSASSSEVFQPYEVMAGTDFKAVGTGVDRTCAVTLGGDVYCMGRAVFGSGATPTPMLKPGATFDALFVGSQTNAALASGRLYMFGSNDDQQVQPEPDPIYYDFVEYPLPATDVVVDVALGSEHTCVLLETGLVECWGVNGTGQLGNGGTSPSSTPTVRQL